MNEEGESVFLQTLSGRVQFPELHASRVGMSRGSAISSHMFTMRSSSGFSSLSWLVRWSLCVASHVRWCRLKSPRTIISVAGFSVHSSSCVSHSFAIDRSEEHTSELQSLTNLVCRLLLEKKKKTPTRPSPYAP